MSSRVQNCHHSPELTIFVPFHPLILTSLSSLCVSPLHTLFRPSHRFFMAFISFFVCLFVIWKETFSKRTSHRFESFCSQPIYEVALFDNGWSEWKGMDWLWKNESAGIFRFIFYRRDSGLFWNSEFSKFYENFLSLEFLDLFQIMNLKILRILNFSQTLNLLGFWFFSDFKFSCDSDNFLNFEFFWYSWDSEFSRFLKFMNSEYLWFGKFLKIWNLNSIWKFL